jgi:hypothetical protein
MVSIFTNCNGCSHKNVCTMTEELQKLYNDISEIDEGQSIDILSNVGINIKCHKYDTNYGRNIK